MKRYTAFLIAILASAVLTVGCGGESDDDFSSAEMAVANDSYVGETYSDDYDTAEYDGDMQKSVDEPEAEQVEENAAATDRKLIRTVNMTVETTSYDELVSNLKAKITACGGYIENSSESVETWSVEKNRNASFTIRVPKEKADEVIGAVENIASVTDRSENVEDVTLNYVDMQSHKDSLETEQKRLLELMEKAESIEDIIALEERLSEVRYQIESMESQLRIYDNKIDYTTIDLNVNEVKKITPEPEPGYFGKIRSDFLENLSGAIGVILDFISWFISSIPYLILWAAVITAIALLVVKPLRKYHKKRVMQRQLEIDEFQAKRKAAAEKAAREAASNNATPNKAAASNEAVQNKAAASNEAVQNKTAASNEVTPNREAAKKEQK